MNLSRADGVSLRWYAAAIAISCFEQQTVSTTIAVMQRSIPVAQRALFVLVKEGHVVGSGNRARGDAGAQVCPFVIGPRKQGICGTFS